MERWKYKVISRHEFMGASAEEKLNKLGKRGWKLMCAGEATWVFMRELEPKQVRKERKKEG